MQLDQRHKMAFFAKKVPYSVSKAVKKAFYLENENFLYAGREVHVDDMVYTYYLFPTAERKALAFLYLGDDVFDEAVYNIVKYNYDGLKKAFPNFINALENGIIDNYDYPALIKLADLDKQDCTFWCLAVGLDDIDFDDVDNEYITGKVKKLFQYIQEMLYQFNENEMTTTNHLFDLKNVYLECYLNANVWYVHASENTVFENNLDGEHVDGNTLNHNSAATSFGSEPMSSPQRNNQQPNITYAPKCEHSKEFGSRHAFAPKCSCGHSETNYSTSCDCSEKGSLSSYSCSGISHSSNEHIGNSFINRLFTKRPKTVFCSVFAPAEIKRNSHFLIQVFLHKQEELDAVKAQARESDIHASRRSYYPLQCKLKKNDKVEIELTICGDSRLAYEKKCIVWQETISRCSFDYYVPKDLESDELLCCVTITINGAIVGEMQFLTEVVASPRTLYTKIKAHQFKKIFISYSHEDSNKVKGIALAYKAQGADYFYDRDKLKAGDIYEEKIFNYIDNADLFILCWSANAAKSEYVSKERHHAMKRAYPQLSIHEAKLKICPISMEPRAKLPDDMKDIYNFEEI